MFSFILEHIGCLYVTFFMMVGNFMCLFSFLGMIISPFAFIPILYAIWYWYDRKNPFLGGRLIKFIRNLPVWRHLANYFPIKLHKTTDLDPSKNYIFAFHPHVSNQTLYFCISIDFFAGFHGVWRCCQLLLQWNRF